MGLRELNKPIKIILVILVIAVVCSITITGVFLGRWINRGKNIEEIVIEKDSDFYWKYNLPGKGTKEEPYIIDGYTLQGNGGIVISGVTKHFIIQNCSLPYRGIKLSNITLNGTMVIRNNLIGGYIGLSIDLHGEMPYYK